MTEPATRIRASFVAVFAVASLALAMQGVYMVKTRELAKDTRSLGRENLARVGEIQESRVASCRQTYESFREVFKPFVPQKLTKPYSPIERRTIQFNRTVDELKRRCDTQTEPKEQP